MISGICCSFRHFTQTLIYGFTPVNTLLQMLISTYEILINLLIQKKTKQNTKIHLILQVKFCLRTQKALHSNTQFWQWWFIMFLRQTLIFGHMGKLRQLCGLICRVLALFKFPDFHQCNEHQNKKAHGTLPTLHVGFWFKSIKTGILQWSWGTNCSGWHQSLAYWWHLTCILALWWNYKLHLFGFSQQYGCIMSFCCIGIFQKHLCVFSLFLS